MAFAKTVIAGGLALSIVGAAAQAADPGYIAPTGQPQAAPAYPTPTGQPQAAPAYPTPTGQPQAAPAYPTPPQSYGRLPGPKPSGSNWIPPSPPRQSASYPGAAPVPYQQQR
jgi:hypothetical protein